MDATKLHQQQRNVNDDSSEFKLQSSELSIESDENMKFDGEISPYYRQDRRQQELRTVTDPTGLARLLNRRYKARCEDNSIQVSAIDAQLKRLYSVVIYDSPPIWSCFLTSPPPSSILRQKAQKRKAVMQRAFGPMGHPYQNAGGVNDIDSFYCDLSATDIHAMLSRYAQCRLLKKWEEANATRFELQLHGVRVCDEILQWTTCPADDFDTKSAVAAAAVNSSTSQAFDLVRNSWRQKHNIVYTVDPRAGPLVGANEEESVRIQQRVEQLVLARSAAMQRGEVCLAVSITLELHRAYTVGVNDATRTWSVVVGGQSKSSIWTPPQFTNGNAVGFDDESNNDTHGLVMFPSTLLFGDQEREFGSTAQYRRSRHSHPFSSSRTQQRVEQLVQERIHKREEAKFLEADAIRRELWRTYVSTNLTRSLWLRLLCISRFVLIFQHTFSACSFLYHKNVGVNDRLQQYSVGGVYDHGSAETTNHKH